MSASDSRTVTELDLGNPVLVHDADDAGADAGQGTGSAVAA